MPASLGEFDLALEDGGNALVYTYNTTARRTGITRLLQALAKEDIGFSDLDTSTSSLEEIFVSLVEEAA